MHGVDETDNQKKMKVAPESPSGIPDDPNTWFQATTQASTNANSDFGQYQAMTTAIATIIRDYNSGQVIQELLQNCDDARARNVTFVLDKRQSCCKLNNALDPFLGPALLQYDDAVFLPKDFASLQKTGDSNKKMDPTSTGKFGLGFNSVYHLSDLPSFISGEVMCLLEPHKRIFRNADGLPSTGTKRMLSDLTEKSHPLHNLLKAFDLGFDTNEAHEGYVPLKDPKTGKFNVTGEHTIPSSETPVKGWPATLFRFPLRTARMREFSQICAKCGAIEHPWDKVLNQIYEPYTQDSCALHRLLFLRCVQSVKLYIWEEGHAKPSPYFSIEIENIKRYAEERRAIIGWLKTGMKEIEKEEKAAGNSDSEEDTTFYSFFKKIHTNKAAATAPRHIIPLTVTTIQHEKTATTKVRDHYVISTGFGNDEDVKAAVSQEAIQFKQCLVPYVAVAAHIARNGESNISREGRCFAVLPTPVRTGGLPVHLDGRWELKVDRNSLVPSLDATGADYVRAEWNKRLLTKVAPPAYARLLYSLTGDTLADWMSEINFPPSSLYALFPTQTHDEFWGKICEPVFRQLFDKQSGKNTLPKVLWGTSLLAPKGENQPTCVVDHQLARISKKLEKKGSVSQSEVRLALTQCKASFPVGEVGQHGQWLTVDEIIFAPSISKVEKDWEDFGKVLLRSRSAKLPKFAAVDGSKQTMRTALKFWQALADVVAGEDEIGKTEYSSKFTSSICAYDELIEDDKYELETCFDDVFAQQEKEVKTEEGSSEEAMTKNNNNNKTTELFMTRAEIIRRMRTALTDALSETETMKYRFEDSREIVDRIMLLNCRLPNQRQGLVLDIPDKIRYWIEKIKSSTPSCSPSTLREFFRADSSNLSRSSQFDIMLLLAYTLIDNPSYDEIANVPLIPIESENIVKSFTSVNYFPNPNPIFDSSHGVTNSFFSNQEDPPNFDNQVCGIRLFGHIDKMKEKFIEVRAAAMLRGCPKPLRQKLNTFRIGLIYNMLSSVFPSKHWVSKREVLCEQFISDKFNEELKLNNSVGGVMKCEESQKNEWFHVLWLFIDNGLKNNNQFNLDTWPLFLCEDNRIVNVSSPDAVSCFKKYGDPNRKVPYDKIKALVDLSQSLKLPRLSLSSMPMIVRLDAESSSVKLPDKALNPSGFHDGEPAWLGALGPTKLSYFKNIRKWKLQIKEDDCFLLDQKNKSLPFGPDLTFNPEKDPKKKVVIAVSVESILPTSRSDLFCDFDDEQPSKAFMENIRVNYPANQEQIGVYDGYACKHLLIEENKQRKEKKDKQTAAKKKGAEDKYENELTIKTAYAAKLVCILGDAFKAGYKNCDKVRHFPLFEEDSESGKASYVSLAIKSTPWFTKPAVFDISLEGIKMKDRFLKEPNPKSNLKELYLEGLDIQPLSIRKFFIEYVLPENIFSQLTMAQQFNVLSNLLIECQEGNSKQNKKKQKQTEHSSDISLQDFITLHIKPKKLFRNLSNDGKLYAADELFDPSVPFFATFQTGKLPHSFFWTENWLDFLTKLGLQNDELPCFTASPLVVEAAERIENSCTAFPDTELSDSKQSIFFEVGDSVVLYKQTNIPYNPLHSTQQPMLGVKSKCFDLLLDITKPSKGFEPVPHGLVLSRSPKPFGAFSNEVYLHSEHIHADTQSFNAILNNETLFKHLKQQRPSAPPLSEEPVMGTVESVADITPVETEDREEPTSASVLPHFVAKLRRILTVSTETGEYVELLQASEVSEKFDDTVTDLRKNGVSSCILEFEIKTVNVEAGVGKIIDKKVIKNSNGEKVDSYTVNISENESLVAAVSAGEDTVTTLTTKPRQGVDLGVWRCPSRIGDILVTKHFQSSGNNSVPLLPETACRSAGITMIRSLIAIASSSREDKLFEGLFDDSWHQLKTLKFFPVNVYNRNQKCVVEDSSKIATPKNHRLCFSVLKTLPKEILELLGKKKKKEENKKSKGYMEKFDNDRVQDLLLEEYEELLKNLFIKLSVNTELDIDVLLGHVIRSGEMNEKWIQTFNEFAPKRMMKSFQKRTSSLFEQKRTKLKSSLMKKEGGIPRLKDVAAGVLMSNRFVKMWSDCQEVAYIDHDDGDEDDYDDGVEFSSEGQTDYANIEDIKDEDELNQIRMSVLRAHSEVGKFLLNMRKMNVNRAMDIETRLRDSLNSVKIVWIRNQSGNLEDCAKKASNTFYTFDITGKWHTKSTLFETKRGKVDFSPIFYELKEDLGVKFNFSDGDSGENQILNHPLFAFYAVLGAKIAPARADLLKVINYAEALILRDEDAGMNLVTNAVGILCVNNKYPQLLELENLKLPNQRCELVPALEMIDNESGANEFPDIDLSKVNLLHPDFVKEFNIHFVLKYESDPKLYSVDKALVPRLAPGATERVLQVDESKALHYVQLQGLFSEREALIGNIEIVMRQDANESGKGKNKGMSYDDIDNVFPDQIKCLTYIDQSFDLKLPSGKLIDVTKKRKQQSNEEGEQSSGGIALIEDKVLYVDSDLIYDASMFHMTVCSCVQVSFNGRPEHTSNYTILQTILSSASIHKMNKFLARKNIKAYVEVPKPVVGQIATQEQVDKYVYPVSVQPNCGYMTFEDKNEIAAYKLPSSEPAQESSSRRRGGRNKQFTFKFVKVLSKRPSEEGTLKIDTGEDGGTVAVPLADVFPFPKKWYMWMITRNAAIMKLSSDINIAAQWGSTLKYRTAVEKFKEKGINDYMADYLSDEYRDSNVNFVKEIENAEKARNNLATFSLNCLTSTNYAHDYSKINALKTHLAYLDDPQFADTAKILCEQLRVICRQNTVTEGLESTPQTSPLQALKNDIAGLKTKLGESSGGLCVDILGSELNELLRQDLDHLDEKLVVFGIGHYGDDAVKNSEDLAKATRFDEVFSALQKFIGNVKNALKAFSLKDALTSDQLTMLENENLRLKMLMETTFNSFETQLRQFLDRLLANQELHDLELQLDMSFLFGLMADVKSKLEYEVPADTGEMLNQVSRLLFRYSLTKKVSKLNEDMEQQASEGYQTLEQVSVVQERMTKLVDELDRTDFSDDDSKQARALLTVEAKRFLKNYEVKVIKWKNGDGFEALKLENELKFVTVLIKVCGIEVNKQPLVTEKEVAITDFMKKQLEDNEIVKTMEQLETNAEDENFEFSSSIKTKNSPSKEKEIRVDEGEVVQNTDITKNGGAGGGGIEAGGQVDDVKMPSGQVPMKAPRNPSNPNPNFGTQSTAPQFYPPPLPAQYHQMKAYKMEEAIVKSSLESANTEIESRREATNKLKQETQEKQDEHARIDEELQALSNSVDAMSEANQTRIKELSVKKSRIIQEKQEIDKELQEHQNQMKALEELKEKEEAKLKQLDQKVINEEEGFVGDLAKLSDDISDIADELVVGITSIQEALYNCNLLMDSLTEGEIRIPNLFVLVPCARSSLKQFFGLQQRFKLVFLCSYDLTAAECGPDGDGYEITVDTQLAKDLLPAMRCAVFALKLANLASKVLLKIDVIGAAEAVTGQKLSAGVMSGVEITPDSLMEDMAVWNELDGDEWDMEAMLSSPEGIEKVQKASGQSYRKLESKLKQLDPGLVSLDMSIAADADHQCRWVKTGNIPEWTQSTERSRRKLLRLEEKNRKEKEVKELLELPRNKSEVDQEDHDIESKMKQTKQEVKAYEDRIKLLEKEVENQNRDMSLIDSHLEEHNKLIEQLKAKLQQEEDMLRDANNSISAMDHDETAEEAQLRKEKEEYQKKAKQLIELEKRALEKEILALKARNKNKEDLDTKKKLTMNAMSKNKEKLVDAKSKLNNVESNLMRLLVSMEQVVQGELEIPRLFVVVPETPPPPVTTCFGGAKSVKNHLLFDHYRLVFLCAYDGSRSQCGYDGMGFKIRKDSTLLRRIRPIVQLTLLLLSGLGALSGVAGSDEFAEAANTFFPTGQGSGLIADATQVLGSIELEEEPGYAFTEKHLTKIATAKQDQPENLIDDKDFDVIKTVTGKAYRELCEWIKEQDFNLSTLVMRKTRDANGIVDWVAPQNWVAWQSSTAEFRANSRRQRELQRTIAKYSNSSVHEWRMLEILAKNTPPITNMTQLVLHFDKLSSSDQNAFIYQFEMSYAKANKFEQLLKDSPLVAPIIELKI